MKENFFDYKRIAEGYAKDRPFLHGKVIERLLNYVGSNVRFENGLDIGCGVGLSTKALGFVCDKVLGTDSSQEMIVEASRINTNEKFFFEKWKAEEIKANQNSFDIVTAAGVINWIDETKFLPLLHRMLKKNGYFLVYDFWISDRMKDNISYSKWWKEEYLPNFPKPIRKELKWTDDFVKPYCFQMVNQEEYVFEHKMNKEQFIRFMLLQSNVIAQVEENDRNIQELYKWFEDTLSKFWENQENTLYFSGYSWYLTKR